MISPARRRLLSAILAMALVYGAAMISVREAGLRWLASAIFFPGLKIALLFYPGGIRGAHANGYLKLAVFLSFLLLCVVIELVWIAAGKLREGRQE